MVGFKGSLQHLFDEVLLWVEIRLRGIDMIGFGSSFGRVTRPERHVKL